MGADEMNIPENRKTETTESRELSSVTLEQVNEELLAINRIITAIAGVSDLENILQKVIDEALAIAGIEGGTICMVTPQDTLELAACRETSAATINDLTTNEIKIGDCLCGASARDHKPLILRDREEVLKFSSREAARGEDIRFHAAFPLITGNRCLGVLCVFTRTDKKPLERRLQLLETVTAQIALVMENARLYKETAQHAAKLEEKVRELEQARAELAVTAREWQMTFDSIGDCVTIHDKDFNLLLANKACEKLFGVSNDEIRSRKCFDLFHERKEPHEACPKIVTEQTGHPFGIEIFEPRFNCWLAITCFPLFDKNGAVQRVVHFAKDITQRKKMEEAIKESEARFRATFEQAAMGIAHVSTDGHWLRVNQKLCDIIGYTSEELLKMTFQDITHPDDLETDLHYVRQVLAGEIKTYSMEKRYFRKDKSLVWVKLTVSLVRDDLGQPHYFISVLEDITEQIKLKAQLLQAQKMEAVGQLAGGVAHDFNNILTAIIGYGNLALMKMAEDDPQRLNIRNMLEGAERAAHLTKELLLFSRKQISERKPVDLNNVITKTEKFLKRVIGEDINYRTMLAERPIPVLADSHQLEQVLMNLVTNARDAMPEGGTLVVLTEQVNLSKDFTSAHGYGKAGAYALITVSDTGKGMDSEMQQRIFEPFFTSKEVGKGTGLGLAVVYGIIKQHDGFVNVYSEPGKGSTFRIYLPLLASPAREEETRLRKEEAPVRGTETVLVAEDDDILRKLTHTVLTQFGYTVIEAVNGEDAVSKFMENKDKIQILLFDLIMPTMNGKDAYDEIRKIKPDMKVIFASGYAPDIARQKMRLEDSVHMLFKPMSPNELLRKLRSVLDETK